MPLEEYKRKRDFSHTPEPAGVAGAEGGGALSFVVHKHRARALHYDVRLELDGVLLSWAVPKGPSLDTHDKHLAVHVEDHPLEYGGFEGTIPAGEYGAGEVIIWDRGTWEPLGDPRAGLEKGDFKFELHGEKLRGVWVLVRMRPRPGEKRDNWLLIKEKDEFVRPHDSYDILAEEPKSVVSGLTVEEVGAAAVERTDSPGRVSAARDDAQKASEPASIPASPPAQPPSQARSEATRTTTRPGPRPSSNRGAPAASDPFPSPVDVELATLVDTAPSGEGWVAEAKYDGYRVVLVLNEGRCRAFTRRHADWSDRFAGVCRAAEELPAASAILDGEAVVFDETGVSRFGLLQAALGSHPERISFAAFDLLYLNGHDLREMPLAQRKELLSMLLADELPTSPVRYAEHTDSSAAELYARACSAGLEGVVCKRADSRYVAGRGRDWQKVKCRHTQELVVGGISEGQGSRGPLGSLLVGVYEGDRLVYAGRVGSGFDEPTLAALRSRLDPLERDTSPFEPAPRLGGHPVRWVEPAVVLEAAFREWTADGVLRQPVFLGVREDKAPREVVRERAETVPAENDPPKPTTKRENFGRPTTVLDVKITNPEKPLFPESSFPKLSLAEYYAAIAPAMLRHVAERPLTLVRCPTGHGRACFYQRHPMAGTSDQIRTFAHTLTGHADADSLLVVDSAEGLVALAQMGVLEIHTWQSHIDSATRPDIIVFDLDPGPGVDWAQIQSSARQVAEDCSALGFEPFLKSTGSKGLHVVLPIKPAWEFVRVRALAKSIVDRIVAKHPDTFTGKMAKDVRGGRVFLDYLRNAEGASAVAPYSTRNKPGPSCAVPLAWEELDDDLDITAFTPDRVVERVRQGVDPWAQMTKSALGVRGLNAAEKGTG